MSGNRPLTPEQQEELAALQAIGLAEEVRERIRPELRGAYEEAAAAAIASYVTPVRPPAALRDRLMARVANFEALKPTAEVRVYDEGWRPSGVEGVDVKMLYRDEPANRSTMLVRMAAGSRYPMHRHHDDEQCLVVRGDICWRDQVYREGDFVVTGRDSTHPELWTENGNLLLIVAGHHEFIRENG